MLCCHLYPISLRELPTKAFSIISVLGIHCKYAVRFRTGHRWWELIFRKHWLITGLEFQHLPFWFFFSLQLCGSWKWNWSLSGKHFSTNLDFSYTGLPHRFFTLTSTFLFCVGWAAWHFHSYRTQLVCRSPRCIAHNTGFTAYLFDCGVECNYSDD